jgi:hypothetical protein
MAVHARPPAFAGADGASWSVDLLTDTTGDTGTPEVTGHLETDFLVRAASEALARHQLGAMPLATVKATLDGLIRTTSRTADRLA